VGVEDRPYAGTWRANKKKIVRYTPDALVFLNGDTALRSQSLESQRIDIQPFITQLSVDHGTSPGTASASLTLRIPRHAGSAIFREGNNLLKPGLEIHIYLRGYYAVPGIVRVDAGSSDYVTLNSTEGLGTGSGSDNLKDFEKLPVRPYYHCFHGVINQASHSFSGGFYDASLNANGMLHFWQYMDMSTNASLFGARPTGSQLRMSLVGHNYTNMTPFSIIYSLYRDTAGAAGAIAWALSSSGNVQAPTAQGEGSLFEMTQLYWEQRFRSPNMYRLRMFGCDGTMFNSAATAMIGRMSSAQLAAAAAADEGSFLQSDNEGANDIMRFLRGGVSGGTGHQDVGGVNAVSWFANKVAALTGGEVVRNTAIDQESMTYQRRSSETAATSVAVHQLKAYVTDISNYGAVNLFESTYESKLDIASAAAQACGYEFFQDVDGDLVFKPPLYNMDTNNTPAFVVKPHEIISISYQSNEPEATIMTVKGEQFSNMNGLGLGGEWGIRGQFVDYKLVAQFGWRPSDFEASFYASGRAAFWAAVARLAVINKSMETASLTIPLRPELRCGYPIYIEHIDCYYYIDNMSHSFQYGGQCTSTLQLVARRRKWNPPATTSRTGGINQVDLGRPDFSPLPLRKPMYTMGADGSENRLAGVIGIKEIGFPNVVMALDLVTLNPLTWALGETVTDLSTPTALNTVLMYLVRNHKLTIAGGTDVNPADPATWGNATWNSSFVSGVGSGASTTTLTETSVEILSGTSEPAQFVTQRGNSSVRVLALDISNLFEQVTEYAERSAQIATAQDELSRSSGGGSQAARDVLIQESLNLRKELIEGWMADDQLAHTSSTVSGVTTNVQTGTSIFDLMKIVRGLTSPERVDTATASSAQILNILGDRKASFCNTSTPGYYRYYSSAHPEPTEQAYTPMRFVASGSGEITAEADPDAETDVEVGEMTKRVRFMSSCDADISKIASASAHVTELSKGLVDFETTDGGASGHAGAACKGFRIMRGRSDSTDPLLPTHKIVRMEFSKARLSYNMLQPAATGSTYPRFILNAETKAGIKSKILEALGGAGPSTSLKEALEPFLSQLNDVRLPSFSGTETIAADMAEGIAQLAGERFTSPFHKISSGGNSVYMTPRTNITTDNKPEIPGFGYGYLSHTGGIVLGEVLSWTNRRGNAVGTYWNTVKSTFRCSRRFTSTGVLLTNPKDWGSHVDGATTDIGSVPLSFMGLVCATFASNGNDTAYYTGRWNNTDASTSPPFEVTRVKLQGIKEKIADLVAEGTYVRINTHILPQVAEMWKKVFPGGRGMVETSGIESYQNLVTFCTDLTTACGGSVAVSNTTGRRGHAMFLSRVAGQRQDFIPSPVFPISDADGYEHFGNFAYGRGVDVADADSFQALMEQDPFRATTSEGVLDAADAFAQTCVSGRHSADVRKRRLVLLAQQISNLNSDELRDVLARLDIDFDRYTSLNSAIGNTGQVSAGEAEAVTARTQSIMLGLINHFSTPQQPQQIQNAAYTLADLTPFNHDGSTEAWVASNATLTDSFVQLEAFDPGNFVYVVSGGEEAGKSPIEDWIMNQIREKSVDWAIEQQALRGQYESAYITPQLDGIFDSWEVMFGEGSGDFWEDQFAPITGTEQDPDSGLWDQATKSWDDVEAGSFGTWGTPEDGPEPTPGGVPGADEEPPQD